MISTFDRDTVRIYKQESAELPRYHSFEEIGRAFLEEAAKLNSGKAEDVERSHFVHRVSFNCFLNLQKKAANKHG